MYAVYLPVLRLLIRVKYKTHDNMLCYVDLLFEGGLQEIPQMDLHEGYRFVKYKPGDKTA